MKKKFMKIGLSVSALLASGGIASFAAVSLLAKDGSKYMFDGKIYNSKSDAFADALNNSTKRQEHGTSSTFEWTNSNGTTSTSNNINDYKLAAANAIQRVNVNTGKDINKLADPNSKEISPDEIAKLDVSATPSKMIKVYQGKPNAQGQSIVATSLREAAKTYFSANQLYEFDGIFFRDTNEIRQYLNTSGYLESNNRMNANFRVQSPKDKNKLSAEVSWGNNVTNDNGLEENVRKVQDDLEGFIDQNAIKLTRFVDADGNIRYYDEDEQQSLVLDIAKSKNPQNTIPFQKVTSNNNKQWYITDNLASNADQIIGPYTVQTAKDLSDFTKQNRWVRETDPGNYVNSADNWFVRSNYNSIFYSIWENFFGDTTAFKEVSEDTFSKMINTNTPIGKECSKYLQKLYVGLYDDPTRRGGEIAQYMINLHNSIIKTKRFQSFLWIPIMYQGTMNHIMTGRYSANILAQVKTCFNSICTQLDKMLYVALNTDYITLNDKIIPAPIPEKKNQMDWFVNVNAPTDKSQYFSLAHIFGIDSSYTDLNNDPESYVNVLQRGYPALTTMLNAYNAYKSQDNKNTTTGTVESAVNSYLADIKRDLRQFKPTLNEGNYEAALKISLTDLINELLSPSGSKKERQGEKSLQKSSQQYMKEMASTRSARGASSWDPNKQLTEVDDPYGTKGKIYINPQLNVKTEDDTFKGLTQKQISVLASTSIGIGVNKTTNDDLRSYMITKDPFFLEQYVKGLSLSTLEAISEWNGYRGMDETPNHILTTLLESELIKKRQLVDNLEERVSNMYFQIDMLSEFGDALYGYATGTYKTVTEAMEVMSVYNPIRQQYENFNNETKEYTQLAKKRVSTALAEDFNKVKYDDFTPAERAMGLSKDSVLALFNTFSMSQDEWDFFFSNIHTKRIFDLRTDLFENGKIDNDYLYLPTRVTTGYSEQAWFRPVDIAGKEDQKMERDSVDTEWLSPTEKGGSFYDKTTGKAVALRVGENAGKEFDPRAAQLRAEAIPAMMQVLTNPAYRYQNNAGSTSIFANMIDPSSTPDNLVLYNKDTFKDAMPRAVKNLGFMSDAKDYGYFAMISNAQFDKLVTNAQTGVYETSQKIRDLNINMQLAYDRSLSQWKADLVVPENDFETLIDGLGPNDQAIAKLVKKDLDKADRSKEFSLIKPQHQAIEFITKIGKNYSEVRPTFSDEFWDVNSKNNTGTISEAKNESNNIEYSYTGEIGNDKIGRREVTAAGYSMTQAMNSARIYALTPITISNVFTTKNINHNELGLVVNDAYNIIMETEKENYKEVANGKESTRDLDNAMAASASLFAMHEDGVPYDAGNLGRAGGDLPSANDIGLPDLHLHQTQEAVSQAFVDSDLGRFDVQCHLRAEQRLDMTFDVVGREPGNITNGNFGYGSSAALENPRLKNVQGLDAMKSIRSTTDHFPPSFTSEFGDSKVVGFIYPKDPPAPAPKPDMGKPLPNPEPTPSLPGTENKPALPDTNKPALPPPEHGPSGQAVDTDLRMAPTSGDAAFTKPDGSRPLQAQLTTEQLNSHNPGSFKAEGSNSLSSSLIETTLNKDIPSIVNPSANATAETSLKVNSHTPSSPTGEKIRIYSLDDLTPSSKTNVKGIYDLRSGTTISRPNHVSETSFAMFSGQETYGHVYRGDKIPGTHNLYSYVNFDSRAPAAFAYDGLYGSEVERVYKHKHKHHKKDAMRMSSYADANQLVSEHSTASLMDQSADMNQVLQSGEYTQQQIDEQIDMDRNKGNHATAAGDTRANKKFKNKKLQESGSPFEESITNSEGKDPIGSKESYADKNGLVHDKASQEAFHDGNLKRLDSESRTTMLSEAGNHPSSSHGLATPDPVNNGLNSLANGFTVEKGYTGEDISTHVVEPDGTLKPTKRNSTRVMTDKNGWSNHSSSTGEYAKGYSQGELYGATTPMKSNGADKTTVLSLDGSVKTVDTGTLTGSTFTPEIKQELEKLSISATSAEFQNRTPKNSTVIQGSFDGANVKSIPDRKVMYAKGVASASQMGEATGRVTALYDNSSQPLNVSMDAMDVSARQGAASSTMDLQNIAAPDANTNGVHTPVRPSVTNPDNAQNNQNGQAHENGQGNPGGQPEHGSGGGAGGDGPGNGPGADGGQPNNPGVDQNHNQGAAPDPETGRPPVNGGDGNQGGPKPPSEHGHGENKPKPHNPKPNKHDNGTHGSRINNTDTPTDRPNRRKRRHSADSTGSLHRTDSIRSNASAPAAVDTARTARLERAGTPSARNSMRRSSTSSVTSTTTPGSAVANMAGTEGSAAQAALAVMETQTDDITKSPKFCKAMAGVNLAMNIINAIGMAVMMYEMFKPTTTHLYYKYKTADGVEYYYNAGGRMEVTTFLFGLAVKHETKLDMNDAELLDPIAFTDPFDKSGLFYNGDIYEDGDVDKVTNQFILDLLTNKGNIQNIIYSTYYNKVSPVYTFAANYKTLLKQNGTIKNPDTQGITFSSKYEMIIDVLMDIILYAGTKNKHPNDYFSTKYSQQYVTSYSFNGIISSDKFGIENQMITNLVDNMRPQWCAMLPEFDYANNKFLATDWVPPDKMYDPITNKPKYRDDNNKYTYIYDTIGTMLDKNHLNDGTFNDGHYTLLTDDSFAIKDKKAAKKMSQDNLFDAFCDSMSPLLELTAKNVSVVDYNNSDFIYESFKDVPLGAASLSQTIYKVFANDGKILYFSDIDYARLYVEKNVLKLQSQTQDIVLFSNYYYNGKSYSYDELKSYVYDNTIVLN